MSGRRPATTICLLFAAVIGFGLYVRLAPVPPADWDRALSTDLPTSSPCAVEAGTGSARAACLVPDRPENVLARLDVIAMATPRTRRIAGSVDKGRITWETRTALWGFPDYTTAQVTITPDGTRLDVYARPRFGHIDGGINAARLTTWLAKI